MRQVCGLDVHKDSVFVCILNENGVVFQDKFGVLTTDLERMLSVMMEHKVSEVGMESTSIYWMPVCSQQHNQSEYVSFHIPAMISSQR